MFLLKNVKIWQADVFEIDIFSFVSAPTIPLGFTAVYIRPRSIKMRWFMPRIPQGIIDRYDLSFTILHSEPANASTVSRYVTHFNISGHREIDGYRYNLPSLTYTATLTPFTIYIVRVTAVLGEHGRGPSSVYTTQTNETG